MIGRWIYNPVGAHTLIRLKSRIGKIISEQFWKYSDGIHWPFWRIVNIMNSNIYLFLKFGRGPFHTRGAFHIKKEFLLQLRKRIIFSWIFLLSSDLKNQDDGFNPNCFDEKAFSSTFSAVEDTSESFAITRPFSLCSWYCCDSVCADSLFTANFSCRLWQYTLFPTREFF